MRELKRIDLLKYAICIMNLHEYTHVKQASSILIRQCNDSGNFTHLKKDELKNIFIIKILYLQIQALHPEFTVNVLIIAL